VKQQEHRDQFIQPAINPVENLSARLIMLNLELEEKNRQLKESQQARERILSNISHDLRAPLSAVRGAVDRLRSGALQEEEKERLAEIIDRRLSSLEQLVEKLSLSQRLDQPEFSLQTEPLSIVPFLEEYFISTRATGKLDGRRATLLLPKDQNLRTNLDAAHFLRVLDNLFSNALHHTQTGDSLLFSCRREGGDILICLRDSGEGISPEDLPHIFERTYTSSKARTPDEGGSGLGLYIAKIIVEKHGGDILCESQMGRGTVFTILLPATAS